jgi:linoleoyl-CoA desaturase
MYDLELGAHLRAGERLPPEKREEARALLLKLRKQVVKDFVVHPLLSGRGWRATLAANASAVLVRNVWSHSVIMCGHFPEGVEVFEQPELDEAETRGDWYVRQMLGSANITGPTLLHVLTGHLSHQIEHHCFPDLPSRRYPEVAPQVRAIFDRYGLAYNARPLLQQVASAWRKVVRLSLP